MSETVICFWNTMQCNREQCPAYHDASLQCMWGMALSRYLGSTEEVVAQKAEAPKETPVVKSMKSDNPFPELKVGGFLPSIAGKISSPIEVREVNTGSGPTPIAEFGITDGASVVKVTVWEPGDKLNNFNVGDWITLTAMSVKEYKKEIQVNTTRGSKISR